MGTNGTIHRNTVSFPINTKSERTLDQNRLSVNVNVAVGLDCSDNRFSDQRFINQIDEDVNSIQGEDEVDVEWAPSLESGNQFQMVVAIRLRPFLQKEVDTKNNIPVVEMNGSTVRIINSDNDNYNRTEFGFDVCLNSSDRDLFDYADQDLVFKKMGEPLLERAMEGYNVCLFAYGQTGSGKSFTMSGTDTNPGIIPRFVHELYKRIQSLTEVLFAVEVSYYEIYNEKIYDLLSDDKNYNKKILRIREHPQTGPYVENLTQHTVEEFDEVMHLLRSGSRRRATASTAINADSSRSHSIFTIILSQLKNNSDEMGLDMSCSCGSRINLIDLAGSERVGVSATSGDRMKEGSLINKSLLNLGKVISKLAEYSAHPTKSAHIPYRDSALTWLLRESLGGNSQTSMIATISPAKCHLEETMSTLRYAATARRIINFVHINEDPKTKKIRELMEIIADLRAKQTLQELDRKDKPMSKGSSEELSSDTIASPDLKTSSSEPKSSTDNSFDSQHSTKSVEKKSIATNTSFVFDRRKSTKGTETCFTEPVVEPIIKKSTANIATNTSFVKPSKKVCSTGTDAQPVKTPPKPKTVDTGIGMSFIEGVDTSTNTSFVELPSNLDLYKLKRLEDMQRQLLEDIVKYKDKVIGEVSAKVDEWSNLGTVGALDNVSEKSDSISDNVYYECEPNLQSTESLDSSHTYVVSNDTTDRTTNCIDVSLQHVKKPSDTGAIPKVRKQITDQSSAKKKDKKKDNKKDTDNNYWGTDAKKSDLKSSDGTQETNWNNDSKQKNKEVSADKKKKSNEKKDNCDEWGQQVNQKSDQNTANEWSVDKNEQKKEKNVTKTDVTTVDDWGTDTNNKTEKSSDKKKDNQWGDEWGEQTQVKDQSQSWDTAAAADQSSKESSDKKNKKKDKKKNKKNKDKDKENNESIGWGTDDKNQSTEQKKSYEKEETPEWGDDWGTDTINKSHDDNQTGGDDNQFDWGTDTTDTTVIVKKESTPAADEDEVW